MHCHFFLQTIQLMFLINKSNKNKNVFNSKDKNRLIQHCLCHLNFNNHQSVFATKTWRKASARSLLISVVSDLNRRFFWLFYWQSCIRLFWKPWKCCCWLIFWMNKINNEFFIIYCWIRVLIQKKMMMYFEINFK